MEATKADYREYLKQNKPEQYQQMQKDGRLEPYLDLRMEQARRYHNQMMKVIECGIYLWKIFAWIFLGLYFLRFLRPLRTSMISPKERTTPCA